MLFRSVPKWHPEFDQFQPFPVHVWIVRHPMGAVLVDTGIGLGNELINEWYRPQVTLLPAALETVGLTTTDITILVLTHLHFDHCGQHAAVAAPVYVQRLEYELAKTSGYTVPEWAAIPETRLRLVDGELEVLPGIRLLPTPGHTPGHQSVIVETGDGRVALGGQCAYRAAELLSGEARPANLHGPEWQATATDSLARIRALAPVTVHLSHDAEVVSL